MQLGLPMDDDDTGDLVANAAISGADICPRVRDDHANPGGELPQVPHVRLQRVLT